MKNPAVVFFVSLAVVVAVAYAVFRNNRAQVESARASQSEEIGEPLPTFKLVKSTGEEFDSASLRGKVWVAGFFFTSCAGPCYKMMKAVSEFQDTLERYDGRIVSITCDPKTDTPEALKKYADVFGAKPDIWYFLRGDLIEIRKVGYTVFKMPVDEGTHSERVFLIDKHGRQRGTYNATKPEQMIELSKKLAQLMKEPGPGIGPASPKEQNAAARQAAATTADPQTATSPQQPQLIFQPQPRDSADAE